MNRQTKLLDQSCKWICEHWNATNLAVPEELLEQWMYERSDDHVKPEGFHLAVFTFGFMQYDLISNRVPEGVKRSYSAEQLLTMFSRWQLKLSLAEVHKRTNLRIRPLPLFVFPENEYVEAWCDMGVTMPAAGRQRGGGTAAT